MYSQAVLLSVLSIVIGCTTSKTENKRTAAENTDSTSKQALVQSLDTASDKIETPENNNRIENIQIPSSPITNTAEGEGPVVPNADEIYIRSVTYAGSGCPEQTVSQNISPDRKAVSFLFAEFLAEITAGMTEEERAIQGKKDCELTIDMQYPNGWTYSVASVDYRGFADFDDGVSAERRTTIKFGDDAKHESFSSALISGFKGDFSFRDTFDVKEEVLAPCGTVKPLIIRVEAELFAKDSDSSGFLSLDTLDGEMSHQFGIKWTECEPLPSEVKNLKADNTANQIVLTWTSGTDAAASFLVAYAEGSDAAAVPETCVGGSEVINANNLIVPNLEAGKTYTFRTCAVNSQGSATPGVTVTASVNNTVPTCGLVRTNSLVREDVNSDGYISPIDVLLIINHINSGDPSLVNPEDQGPPYLDVNGDCYISPLDALIVINFINSRTPQ
jgi:hypothetical protein